MNNNEEVYYIADIHPGDAWYNDRDDLLGKQVKYPTIITSPYKDWSGVICSGVKNCTHNVSCFAGVKLTPTPPKKSFWQKLFTWNW